MGERPTAEHTLLGCGANNNEPSRGAGSQQRQQQQHFPRRTPNGDKVAHLHSLMACTSSATILTSCVHSTSIPGQYKIQELDKLMLTMHKQYGKIAKVGGLIGHPDLLFIYDGDEIRKVFQREEIQPHR